MSFQKMFKFLNRSLSTCNERKYDVVVVGGGIIGTSTARELLVRHSHIKLALVEKEDRLAKHQSGNNSGVIHTGVYYTPGTLKAKLCTEGMSLLYKYMNEKNIPYEKVGKLVVATSEIEVERLRTLWICALKNDCPNIELIDTNTIKKYEPYCKGIKAIWSPETGIVDYGLVTKYFGEDVKNLYGEIYLNFKVDKFAYSSDPDYPIHVMTKDNLIIATKYAITCGGLQSDQLAELTGCSSNPKIIPIREEYLLLNKAKCHMVNGNIYSVPNPVFPFASVQISPRMDGTIWMGPNVKLALKREGYNWKQINIVEVFDALRYPGFLKLATKYMEYGIGEKTKSFWEARQLKHFQKFIIEIQETDATQGPTGVRAQAVDERGNLIEDFMLEKCQADNEIAKRIIHCRNIPSSGATCSMAIAKLLADEMNSQFKLKS